MVNYLIRNSVRKNLMASMPLLGWTFGDDNMIFMLSAVSKLDEPTTVLIRQFTDIDSPIPLKSDPSRFIPMKRIVAGIITKHSVEFMTPETTKECFETDANSGERIAPQEDYIYVTAESIFGKLASNAIAHSDKNTQPDNI